MFGHHQSDVVLSVFPAAKPLQLLDPLALFSCVFLKQSDLKYANIFITEEASI